MKFAKFAAGALVAGSMVLSAGSALAQAENYPNQPIRVVVPFSAGGSLQAIMTMVGEELTKMWGQPIVIDSRPGAGGAIGAEFVAGADPDGYTLLFTSQSIAVNETLQPSTVYSATESFEPVIHLASGENVLVVPSVLPVNTLQEFIAYAKANPISYASQGSGSLSMLAAVVFGDLADIEMQHIPYTQGAQSVNDLTLNQVQLLVTTVTTAMPQIQAGGVKALAIAGAKRNPQMPDVPTFAEAGMPEFTSTIWYSVFAPEGTDPAIVAKLNDGFNQALQAAAVQERLPQMGISAGGGSAADAEQFLANEIERWRQVVTSAGLVGQ